MNDKKSTEKPQKSKSPNNQVDAIVRRNRISFGNDAYWDMIADLPLELIDEDEFRKVQEYEDKMDREDYERQCQELSA